MKLHLGIDIGVQGAIAIVDESGGLVQVTDMPTLTALEARWASTSGGSIATPRRISRTPIATTAERRIAGIVAQGTLRTQPGFRTHGSERMIASQW